MEDSSNFPENAITLTSSDGVTYEIEEDVAVQIKTIHMFFEDLPVNGRKFPVPDVTGVTLGKVIEYCEKHVESPNSSKPEYIQELKKWDQEFVKGLDLSILFDVIEAADFLYVKSLLELTCEAVADMIRGKTPEEIRKTFNIINDFTPEEEAQVRKENEWAFV
ncbi:SKP1-like protein 13 [Amaranthus tricolor]|uniref:SKP1-like protein 13 n=1 Tax=Amaranthus tricolor TaxID=29722 RepID=UPI00258C2E59|nr:SKP1-like protein 13 [Amaranthus tricolor]